MVIGGKANSDLLNSASTLYLIDGSSNIPFWTNTQGFVELLSSGQTVDFVRFGSDTVAPITAGAWTGANVAGFPVVTTKPDPTSSITFYNYNTSIVRLASSFQQTHTAADWSPSSFTTPGGPNDVAPGAVDSDGDGIPDSAKAAGGTFAGLDLYSMGARQGQKDLFIQVDYMNSTDPGITPRSEALANVVQAFKSHNIAVHFDTGNLFSGSFNPALYNLSGSVSNQRPFTACSQLLNSSSPYFGPGCISVYAVKTPTFDVRRKPFFRYMLMASSQQANGLAGSSGIAEIAGNDFEVSLGKWGLSTNNSNATNQLINYQAATIMHELGHTLGLRHGGDEDANYKPNYYSIMNYLYQLDGLPNPVSGEVNERYYLWQNDYLGKAVPGYPTAGTFPSCAVTNGPCSNTFKLDYSNGSGSTLDENNLDENQIIGRGTAAGVFGDWNLNSSANYGYAYDVINGANQSPSIPLGVLHDYNDWANLILNTSRYYYSNNTGASQTPTQVSQPYDPIVNFSRPTIQEDAPPASFFNRILRVNSGS